MKRRCVMFAALMVLLGAAGGLPSLFAISEPRHRLHEAAQLVDIAVAYYLNDRERPASACRMAISMSGEAVEPKVVAGRRYWYQPRPRPAARSDQRLILRCDVYVAAVSVAAPFDLLKGRVSVALSAFSPPHLVLRPEPHYPFFAPDDERFLTGGLHLEGRRVLSEEWARLPPDLRRSVVGAYVLIVSDGASVIISPAYR